MPDDVETGDASITTTAILIGLGTALAVVALIYFGETANELPGFLPGHTAGATFRRIPLALISLTLALLCLSGAWLHLKRTSGGRSSSTSTR